VQDQLLQKVLDDNRSSPDALLAVRNESCGTSIYISGDECHATADSLWRIGSVTKTYVAAALMSLAAENQLSLDDTLQKWLPQYAELRDITLRQLLAHRSGIFNYTEDAAFHRDRSQAVTPDGIVRLALSHAPYFPADSGFHYSNTGYTLLGMVLEAVTGRPLAEVIRARAFVPAELEQTYLDGAELVAGTLAHGILNGHDVTYLNHPSRPWAAGAVVATGADLVDWIWTLYGTERVLNAQQRRIAIEAGNLPGNNGYGLGVMTISNPNDPTQVAHGHTGGIEGYVTSAFFYPAMATAIAVVINGGQKPPDVIRGAAFRALFPNLP
jgi:D-alanyl-D-alanine carboxypeptidase